MKHYFSIYLLITILTGNYLSAQIPAQTIPDFKFFRLDQSLFTEKDLPPGKMLFFVFFDADCDHCQRAVKRIDENYAQFEKAAVFLISMDSREKIDRFVAAYGTHLKTQRNVLLLQDNLKLFITNFKPRRYPSMFLYAADKKLIDYEDNEETVFRFINAINPKKKT
jgi:hypothetical protein